MINILFVHSSSELYGSDRSLLNIVSNMDKKKFRVFVLLPCEGPLVNEMRKLENVTVEIFEVAVLRRKNLSVKGGLEYLRDFWNSERYINQYIKKHNIDIVDTNTAVVFPGAVVAKRNKVKSVWHIREIIKSNLENRIISFVMNRYADVIVANSDATGKALKVAQSKVRTVYNAVDERTDSVKGEHEIFIVGMAGRINRWKGQKLFVDAAEIVHEIHPNVQFQIAGDVYSGEEQIKEDLIKYINDKNLQDTVILLGQVNNMSSFYNSIDVFVLPSIQPEPFGLVVIEAMEYAIPVIATNHGGPVEIIDDGKTGYLVDFNNAVEMANRINELISNPKLKTQLGEEGKRVKREKFSVSAMVSAIEKIFEEIC